MDPETQRIFSSSTIPIKNINKQSKRLNNKIIFFITIITLILILFGYISYFYKMKSQKNKFMFNKEEINEGQNQRKGEEISYDEFDIKALEFHKQNQIYFCQNTRTMRVKEYDSNIQSIPVHFLSENFNLYAYKNNDIVSSKLLKSQTWETIETQNMLSALKFYASQKSISKKDIYVLDIGSNIGWHSFVLGKFGYNVISFETSKMNNYILNRNFCLNQDLNVILIKKGLYSEEKVCSSFISKDNIGDEIIFCDKNETIPQNYIKDGKTYLTVLDKYVTFLTYNNLALIKIDVEGNEGKIFEGGIRLITKYHVPFIFMEFNKASLKSHGSDPKNFLELFENNGYKFKKYNFFDNHLISIDEILDDKNEYINLYITHKNIFKF